MMHGPAWPNLPSMAPIRVLIAGGGIAAVETLLGLHALAGEHVEIELLSDSSELVNRPSSVTQPFGRTPPRRVDLARIAADCGAHLRHGSLDGVDLESNVVQTRGHERIRYDVFVVAIGAQVHDPLAGALSFRGPESAAAFRALLRDLHMGHRHDVVFTIPIGTSWPLPLYELALLPAARVRAMGVPNVRLTLATPEDRPLHVFGSPASQAVADLLRQAGVELVTGVFPVAVEPRQLRLSSDRTLPADRVVTLPQLRGPSLLGLPHDGRGLLETDLHGQVRGTMRDDFLQWRVSRRRHGLRDQARRARRPAGRRGRRGHRGACGRGRRPPPLPARAARAPARGNSAALPDSGPRPRPR